MYSVYLSACIFEVTCEVLHRMAMARNIVLWTSFWHHFVLSSSDEEAVRDPHICARETGKSNSTNDLHWSAFSFPCPASPKFEGGPRCQDGRLIDLRSAQRCSNSRLVRQLSL